MAYVSVKRTDKSSTIWPKNMEAPLMKAISAMVGKPADEVKRLLDAGATLQGAQYDFYTIPQEATDAALRAPAIDMFRGE